MKSSFNLTYAKINKFKFKLVLVIFVYMSVVYALLLEACTISLKCPILRKVGIRKDIYELISIRDNNRDSIYMYMCMFLF